MNEPRPIDSRVLNDLKTGAGQRGWFRWWMIAIVLALAVVALGVWLSWPKPTRFVTAPIERSDITVLVTATGTLEPEEQVDVGAEVSGLIAEVLVDFNDPVTRGQVIARLNTATLDSRVVSARASLASAEAGVRSAEATQREALLKRDRLKELRERGSASQQELDSGQAALDRAIAAVQTARAQVALAEAQLKTAETDLSKAVIISPIDGIVLDRKIEQGQTVAASFQTPVLFTIASDLTRMELRVDIDEADIGEVREEQDATFEVDAYPGRKFAARIVSVHNAPVTVNNVVTYQAILTVTNAGNVLKPGMTATAEITVAEIKSVQTVPNGALRFTPPGQRADRLDPTEDGQRRARVWTESGGTLTPHVLVIGATDGVRTQILSGDLPEGAAVLIDVQRTTDE